jgi:hypothetical protein
MMICEAATAFGEGAERERLWNAQLQHTPYFAGFQDQLTRRIPVVVLVPATA